MAYVAETMGARQVELPDMAGEYTKGVTDAAAIAAARAKQEQIGLELEGARLKQDQMKASIFLNSLQGIANAPNPAVKKILQKQAEQQISKMYGIQPNSDTMTALIASPDFASTVQSLMDNIGLTGMGREYVDTINKSASATNQPMLDFMKTLKEGFEMMLEEKKAKAAADAAAARQYGTQTRFDEGQLAQKEEKIKTDIQKSTDPLSQGYTQLLNAQQALKRGDWQGVSSILSILAKNVGADAGALSVSDLRNFLPKTFEGDLAQVDAYLDNPSDAKITGDLTKGLRDLVTVAASNMAKRYSERLQLSKNFYLSGKSYQDVDVNSLFAPSEQYIKDLRSFGGFEQKPGALAPRVTPIAMAKANYSYEKAVKFLPEIAKKFTKQEWEAKVQELKSAQPSGGK
jgi:hypothetical protein